MGGLGCDNMTVVLVCFLQGLTWQQYCEKCAKERESSPEPADEDDGFADDDDDTASHSFVTPPHTPLTQHAAPAGVANAPPPPTGAASGASATRTR